MASSSLFVRLKEPFSLALQDTTTFQRLNKSYRSLRERDQWALKILAVFLVMVLAYSAIIRPAQQYAYTQRDAAGRNDHTLQWMRSNRALVQSPGNANSAGLDGQSLLAVASASAKDNGLKFKRFEPIDETSIRVWLEGVDFNTSIRWIEGLHVNTGIAVRELQLDQTNSAVDMNLVIQIE